MIKKTILALVLSCLLISCGKKGDPLYKDTKKISEIQKIYINKA